MADKPEQFAGQGDTREAVQEVLRAIRRNKVRVAFTTLVVVLLGVALSMLWPNKFESSTLFILRQSNAVMDSVMLKELQDLPLQKRLKTLENELRSRKRVEAVMNELAWPEWLETAGKEADRRDLLLKIGTNLVVEMDAGVTGDYTIHLTFRWTNPRKAADFVNRMRDMWIQLTIETYKQSLEQAKDRLEGVVQDRDNDYNAALSAVKVYQQEHDVPGLYSVEVNNQMKATLEVDLSKSQAELESTSGDMARLEDELKLIPKELPQVVAPTTPEQAELLVKMQAAEATLKSVSDPVTGYTPAAPKRKQAQAEYDLLLGQLKKAGYDTEGGSLKSQVNPLWVAKQQEYQEKKTHQAELAALVSKTQKAMDDAQARLDALPVVTADLQRLQADVAAKAQLQNDAHLAVQPLREKVAQLRAQSFGTDTDALGLENSGTFEIIEIGVEPDSPVLPITAIILAIALVVGVGIGAMGPVITEMTRSSFGTVREVGRSLGVPVLGAVDLILTARDLRARRLQRGLTYATMALVLLSLATAIYIYQAHPEVLPDSLRRTLREVRMALT